VIALMAFHDVALAVAKLKPQTASGLLFQRYEESKTALVYAAYRVEEATFTSRWRRSRARRYELIQVELPRLAAVREEDGAAWLAHAIPRHLASLVKPRWPSETNTFGAMCWLLSCGHGGHQQCAMCAGSECLHGRDCFGCRRREGQSSSKPGTSRSPRERKSFVRHEHGDGQTRFAGNKETPNVLIGQKSACRLTSLRKAKADANLAGGSEAGRQRMPSIPRITTTTNWSTAFIATNRSMRTPATFNNARS